MEIVAAYTLLSSGQPKLAESKLAELRSRPKEAIEASLKVLGSNDTNDEADYIKILAAQMLVSVAKHVDVTELIRLVTGRTLSSSVQLQLHVSIAAAVLSDPVQNWLDFVWSQLSGEDGMGVLELIAARCRNTPSKHSIILGQTRAVIDILGSLYISHIFQHSEGSPTQEAVHVAIVRVAKAWMDLASSSHGGEAYLLLWAESRIFQQGILALADINSVSMMVTPDRTLVPAWFAPQYGLHSDLFNSFFVALGEKSERTRDCVSCAMQGLNTTCDVMHALESCAKAGDHACRVFAERLAESESAVKTTIDTMLITSCSLYEILLPLCTAETEYYEVLLVFIRQVRSTAATLGAMGGPSQGRSELGQSVLDASMLLLEICSTVGEELQSCSNGHLSANLDEAVWMAVQIAVHYSLLDEQSCVTTNDPTSEIGPEYVQGEGGQVRKRLREVLRQCCVAFPGVTLRLRASLRLEVERFTSHASSSWVVAEAWVHATTAVTKTLLINPSYAIDVLELMANPALCLPCRPIHKFVVVLVGDLLPPLLLSKHLGGDEEVVSRAFSVVLSSLHCAEESPKRLNLQEGGILPGAALAFRLKQDHIGIVSLDRLLSCATLPLTMTSTQVISAANLWPLLSSASGTTFKSCLLAAGAVAKALVRTQAEATLLAPLAGAALLHGTAGDITSRMLVSILQDTTPTLSPEACFQVSATLKGTLTQAKVLSLLSTSLQASGSVWPVDSRVRWIARLYPSLRSLCFTASSGVDVQDSLDELFGLLVVSTRMLSRPQGAHGEELIELCGAGLRQLTDTTLSLLESPSAVTHPRGATKFLRTVANTLLSWRAESDDSSFSSSLETLFAQGSPRAIQVIQVSAESGEDMCRDAKIELLGMWREVLQAVSAQLGAQALQEVVFATCGYLLGQPHDLAKATDSPSLSNAIFALLAVALHINEEVRFLTEQHSVLCCQALWVALSHKAFAEHLEKIYSAIRSLVKAYGHTTIKCLRLALKKPTTPLVVVDRAQAVVETLCEAANNSNKKRFRTAAKSLQRLR